MLADPIYIGYYAWNRTHHGKFHRYKGGQTIPELNYEEQVSRNDEADWVLSHRLFDPLVDLKTWDAVQHKLRVRCKRAKAPTSAVLDCYRANFDPVAVSAEITRLSGSPEVF